MKKIYEAPELELVQISINTALMASAEGNPRQIIDDEGNRPVE